MTNNFLFVALLLSLTSNLFSNIFLLSATNASTERSITIFQDINDDVRKKMPLQKLSEHTKNLATKISTRCAAGDIIFYQPSLSTHEIHARYSGSLQELYYLLKIDESFDIEDFSSEILRSQYTQQLEYCCSQLEHGIKIDITGIGAAIWLHLIESLIEKLSNEDRYSPADAMFFQQHMDGLICYLIESVDHCVNTMDKLSSVKSFQHYNDCYKALKLLQAAIMSEGNELQKWVANEQNLSLLALDYTMLVVLDYILHTERNVSLILNEAQAACLEKFMGDTNCFKQVR